jgi:hypothetical protein
MANEREPDNPLPSDFVPEGSVETHRVSDGEDWASVAGQYNVKVDDLIHFNFHTNVPEEVNWYLRRNTGCNVSNDGGLNWAFSSSADPGLIYIPPSEVIDMEPEDVTPVATGDAAATDIALRLTFSYNREGVTLDFIQTLEEMPTSESDPLKHEQEAGFWCELRDADNTTLYRQVMHNPLRYDAEVYLEDEETIVRQVFNDYAGTFDLLVPKLATATQIALFSSPLNPETLGEAAAELATFGLAKGGVA